MHYVIGDVHGCFDELMTLIEKIEARDGEAQFILVGDLIDRGPKTWDVLQWALENITPDGKYQCMRGNHEQLALEWWKEYRKWYAHAWQGYARPKSEYDIADVLYANVTPQGVQGYHNPEDFKELVDFWSNLPYHKTLSVKTVSDREVRYRIVHGWFDYYEGEHTIMQHNTNLWERNYWGNRGNPEEIIVFGHTPTIAHDFTLRGCGQDLPGLICYRDNAINVDCGCVYGKGEYNVPCMLGAICLENMEEIYPWTFEERMTQLVAQNAALPDWFDAVQYAEAVIELYHEKYRGKQEDNIYRKKMLKDFGFV